MYAALFWRRVTGLISRLWQGVVIRSGMVTITVLAITLLTLAFGWREHMRGQFARLKREFNGNPPARSAPLPLPGGQEPVVLERSTIEGGSVPEFLSATLLPGRGMSMFQIKAHIPGRGEVGLLASPPLAEAAALMTGNGADANGSESLAVGGAFEIPWAGRVFGAPSENGLYTARERRNIRLPADRSDGGKVAEGGLVLRSPFSSVKINAMPDGGEAEAVYEAGNFDGRWPSKLQITSTTQLSSRVLEMKVTVRNTGDEPAPVGIGWLPRFAILDGGRGEFDTPTDECDPS